MFEGDIEGKDPVQRSRAFVRRHLKDLLGLEDTSGVELVALVRATAHLYELAESQRCAEVELSGPRWGLLLFLMARERMGNREGVTPTSLSRFQGVSKNSISSLLRGLEEQGYIQRTLDPDDYRVFRIQLTDAGRRVVQSLAPERLAGINRLASDLSGEERQQLITLLEKLHHSVRRNAHISGTHRCGA